MTLTTAIRTNNSALSSHAQQVANISRNISGVGDPTYVRRESEVYTSRFGSTRVETQRVVNQSVHTAMISSESAAAKARVITEGLDRLFTLQGGNDFAYSPAKLLGDLQQATELAAASPSDEAATTSLIEQARIVANTFNASYGELLSMRQNADKEIAQSVNEINSLLQEIKTANDEVVAGTISGRDVFDSMDLRDQLISRLSEEIAIKVIPQENNEIIITTESGAMLLENNPRPVTFEPIAIYGPNTIGNELVIDGVTVSGPNATLRVESGKIAGNLELRDDILPTQQSQLDEIARGLIEIFAEQDQTGGGKPPLAGLFTWAGGPAIPASSTLETGIAASIRINPLIDSQVGGDPTLIRDGALNGDTDYLYNAAGSPAFSDRLFALSESFDTAIGFDPNTKLPASQSLTGYANYSVDFLNAQRSVALGDYDYRVELNLQFEQSFQNESGPNLDYEMSRLLEVERAYQATARLLNTIDEMFATLIEAAA